MNPLDISTITAFDLLVEQESADYTDLANQIEQCATYGKVAALMDEWLTANPEIEKRYNGILADLGKGTKKEDSRFFQGIKDNPQNEESLHRESIQILTNKMRERSLPNPPKNDASPQKS
jgi:hypothetical protein